VGLAFKSLETGLTLLINEHVIFPSASLIKLPIMTGTAVLANKRILQMSDMILVEPDIPEVVKQREQDGSGVLARLSTSHELTIEELCTLMIIVSDNVATNLLLSNIGMDAINQTLSELGFSITRVTHKLEDFEELEDPLENPTTAYEMLSLLEMVYRGHVPFSQRIIEILKQQQFNSRLPMFLPSDLKIAHKTGSLQHVFHDVGVIYSPVGNYILCVLTEDMPSRAIGGLVIAEISRIVYESFTV
jgi:beta-lactamase class A